MRTKQSKLVLSCAATVAALSLSASPVGAQTTTERFQVLLQRAVDSSLAQQDAQGQTTTPTTGTPAPSRPAIRPRPNTTGVVGITLDDAVKAALDHNLNIEVTRLNPQINDLAYASIASTYNLALTSQVSTQSQTTPPLEQHRGRRRGGGDRKRPDTIQRRRDTEHAVGRRQYAVTLNNNKRRATAPSRSTTRPTTPTGRRSTRSRCCADFKPTPRASIAGHQAQPRHLRCRS